MLSKTVLIIVRSLELDIFGLHFTPSHMHRLYLQLGDFARLVLLTLSATVTVSSSMRVSIFHSDVSGRSATMGQAVTISINSVVYL